MKFTQSRSKVKKKRTCDLTYFAVLADHRKEIENINKYLDLAREHEKLGKMKEVVFVSFSSSCVFSYLFISLYVSLFFLFFLFFYCFVSLPFSSIFYVVFLFYFFFLFHRVFVCFFSVSFSFSSIFLFVNI